VLHTLIHDDELFQEILVRVLTQGIQFDGWVGLTTSGISLVGSRLVAVIVDPVWSCWWGWEAGLA